MKFRITALALLQMLPMSASAALMLTIDNYTSNELAFSISGTFDTDTVGDNPGLLAIKKDWSASGGVHTDLWNGAPTITLNTITFDGEQRPTTAVDSPEDWADSLYFLNWDGEGTYDDQTPYAAGTAVSGSIVLSGAGMFNPTANPANIIELVSGFSWKTDEHETGDYVRLEAVADIPLPAASYLFLSALVGLVGTRLTTHKK